MTRNHSNDKLLTPEQASEALGYSVTSDAIRQRIKRGSMKCYWKNGLISVKRSELLAWKPVSGWRGTKKMTFAKVKESEGHSKRTIPVQEVRCYDQHKTTA